uniref:Uncharacterized protein n=1 Tax=Phaeomonas parva TaxID=124430 RepID=A0A6U4CKB2_9STRA
MSFRNKLPIEPNGLAWSSSMPSPDASSSLRHCSAEARPSPLRDVPADPFTSAPHLLLPLRVRPNLPSDRPLSLKTCTPPHVEPPSSGAIGPSKSMPLVPSSKGPTKPDKVVCPAKPDKAA